MEFCSFSLYVQYIGTTDKRMLTGEQKNTNKRDNRTFCILVYWNLSGFVPVGIFRQIVCSFLNNLHTYTREHGTARECKIITPRWKQKIDFTTVHKYTGVTVLHHFWSWYGDLLHWCHCFPCAVGFLLSPPLNPFNRINLTNILVHWWRKMTKFPRCSRLTVVLNQPFR